MNIPEPGLGSKEHALYGSVKYLVKKVPRDGLIVGVVAVALATGFGLGNVSGKGTAAPITPEMAATEAAPGVQDLTASAKTAASSAAKTKPAKPQVGHSSGTYVASKNGTKIYLPTCSGAKRIKPENMIWFVSKEEAAAAGFTPSSTCKGM